MLKIRLQRRGATHSPFYRIVVSESREHPESGSVVETLGHYDPMRSPKVVRLDLARLDEWVAKGAQPSTTVARLARAERRAQAEGATA